MEYLETLNVFQETISKGVYLVDKVYELNMKGKEFF